MSSIQKGNSGAPNYFHDLNGKTVIITGSTKGIGLEIAKVMLATGANVVLNSRSQKDVEITLQKLSADPQTRGTVKGMYGDVGIFDTCEKLAEFAAQNFGKIDVLVNNAGTSMIADSLDLRQEDWERTIRTNLSGPFYLSQACGKTMAKNGGGSIINVSSMFGSGGVPKRLAYCSSKFGLNGLTKTLAAEWAHYKIRVNAISPGYIETPMDQGDQTTGGYSMSDIHRRTPMGRYGTSKEVANVALFLASDMSSYITGDNIVVDGGWLAYIGWEKLLNEIK
jgi:3-oxoacyl-[acyl-carrier protein] reductase